MLGRQKIRYKYTKIRFYLQYFNVVFYVFFRDPTYLPTLLKSAGGGNGPLSPAVFYGRNISVPVAVSSPASRPPGGSSCTKGNVRAWVFPS